LGVSQPMVSISLRKLRQSLADELFVHSGSEMVPTERALAFEEPLRNIIHDIRHCILEEAGFDPEREGGVRICLSDIGELEFIPNLIRRTQREAPGMVIRSVVLEPAELERKLESGEVDLAIGYFPYLLSSNFQQQLLFEHRFAWRTSRYPRSDINGTVSVIAARRCRTSGAPQGSFRANPGQGGIVALGSALFAKLRHCAVYPSGLRPHRDDTEALGEQIGAFVQSADLRAAPRHRPDRGQAVLAPALSAQPAPHLVARNDTRNLPEQTVSDGIDRYSNS
jgi:hypothetical protein